MGLSFCIVDVFSVGRYTGNQLAVFRNAGGLKGEQMQAIAREMNFSETTFILSERERHGGYDVRIFTPKEELPFAGHPTLGTAFVILEEILRSHAKELALNLKVGRIPVRAEYQRGRLKLLWMKQKAPEFLPGVDADEVCSLLGVAERDLDRRFPIEQVSTGVPFLIVPLGSRKAVKSCRVSVEKYDDLTKRIPSKGVLVFCQEPYDRRNDINARMFAPYYGVAEDPATGSANGCLAAYLVKHRYFARPRATVRVEQGYEIGRPSLLFLKSAERDGSIDVSVGGEVAMVAKGEFL